MIPSRILTTSFSPFLANTFSTLSRSLKLEKCKNTTPALKAKSFTYRHIGPTPKDIQTMLEEIQEVEDGIMDKDDNILKNAPHTQECVTSSNWNHKYSREKAAFPLGYRRRKVWPTTRRVNNVYGDLHLITKCLH